MKQYSKIGVAILGASLTTVPPVVSALSEWCANTSSIPNVPVGIGMMTTLIIVFLLSIVITVKSDHKHILECVMCSAGLPGVLLSIASTSQFFS